MNELETDAGLIFLGALYVIPEILIILFLGVHMEPWNFWLVVLGLPVFMVIYYWNKVRALAYGFLVAILLNISVWGAMAVVVRMAFRH